MILILKMLNEPFKNSAEIISLGMIADTIGVSKPTIVRWINDEGFPAIRIKRKYFFRWTEVKNWLDKKTLNKPKKQNEK